MTSSRTASSSFLLDQYFLWNLEITSMDEFNYGKFGKEMSYLNFHKNSGKNFPLIQGTANLTGI